MTNEEIRNKFVYQTFSDGKPYYTETDIDCVQNITRKDEREKVIEEIDKWITENTVYMPITKRTSMNIVTVSGINRKLNSLK